MGGDQFWQQFRGRGKYRLISIPLMHMYGRIFFHSKNEIVYKIVCPVFSGEKVT